MKEIQTGLELRPSTLSHDKPGFNFSIYWRNEGDQQTVGGVSGGADSRVR